MARGKERGYPSARSAPRGSGSSQPTRDDSRAVNREGDQVQLEQLREANERLVIAGVREQELAEMAERETARMNALLGTLVEGVAILDGEGRIVLMNRAGRDILSLPEKEGPRTLEELRSLDFRGTDGEPLDFGEWPLCQALRGEQFSNREVIWVRPEGGSRQLAFSGSSLRNEQGAVVLAITVFRDVTEQRLLEKTREEYIALISHDLRSPLTAVMGHAGWLVRLLQERGLDREAASAGLILTSAKRMDSMIQDLVESAHLESGRVDMRKQPADLLLLVADLAERVGTPEDRARIRLEFPERVAPVSIDPDRIERALTNLITNALKYSPPEAPVVVRVEEADGEVVLSVRDQGPGIAPEELQHIFDRFYRARAGKKVEGLGLGLYIARLIVEAHGGRIWATSHQGVGSTFRFALPAAAP